MTTNRFLIFLGLKCEEIFGSDSFTAIAFIAIIIAIGVGSLLGLEYCMASASLGLLFLGYYVKYFVCTVAALLILTVVIGLIVTFCKWIADNWRLAGRISEERKINQKI